MGYDLAIIGSGSAAFASAIAATESGASVVMIERATIGGTCVNVGCVPSKALLAAAEARHRAASQPFPGISTAAGVVDGPALLAGKNGLVAQLQAEKYVDLAAGYGWEMVTGTAVFTGTPEQPALQVALAGGGTRRIEAAHYLVATGAAPWAPPIPGLRETGYLTSTTALELDHIPETLLVLGGNAIGLELAQMFARLGSRVTVVEALRRLAPFEEPEISRALDAVLTGEGIEVHTGATVTSALRDEHGYRLTVAGQHHELGAAQLLVATGRRPVIDELNLGVVEVKTGDRGEIIVDDTQQSSNPRIWAAGDVTGSPQFVYVAAAQGNLAAANALTGTAGTLDYRAVPRVTFTSPAIASVGLTDKQAVTAGIACTCRVLPLTAVPRALVNRETNGLIKIVAEQGTGRIVGVHVLAEHAGEIITAAVYAMTAGMSVQQIATAWAPYLTMSEALRLAAQSFTRDIRKLSCCA